MQTRPRLLGNLLLLLLASLALAACVRPYPGGEPIEAQPLPEVIITPEGLVPLPTPETLPDLGQPTPEPVPIETLPEAIEPTTEPAPVPAETVHTVVAGDTLFKIALQYDVTLEEITAVNDIPDINRLEVGQTIIIPAPGSVPPEGPDTSEGATDGAAVATPLPEEITPQEPAGQSGGTHVVRPGENLFRIGLQYGCSVNQMAAANGIANPTYIYVGQELVVPDCN